MPAKVDFKNLFTNKKDFPDTMEITLANGATVTVGDLREYNDSVGGELAREFKARETELVTRQRTVEAATERVAHIITELQQGRVPDDAAALGIKVPKAASSRSTKAEGELTVEDLQNDPYLRPLLSQLQEKDAKIAAFERELGSLKGSVSQASLAFINRELSREYDRLPLKDLDKAGDEVSLTNLTKYAVDHGLLTRDKLPDISRAFNDVAGPKLMEKRLADAEKKGYEKRNAEIADQVALPGGSGFGLPEPTGPKPIDTKGKRAEQILSESLANAAKDKDMWRGIMHPAAS